MKVKICNIRGDNFDADFLNSVINTGFAVITHHGIDRSLIKEAQDVWREFFLSTPQEKNGFINRNDPNMGYKSFGSEKAVGAKKPDLKEFFHWQPGQEIPGEAFGITQKMFFMLEDLSDQLLAVLDTNSDREAGFFRNACSRSDNTLMRPIYYPAMNSGPTEGAVRSAAHEDINFITLLVAASASGLQVKDMTGRWHDVPHEENSVTVNIGDMLQLASHRLYKSTTHRVINPTDSKSDRISIPLFVHPNSEVVLAEGVTAGQYLQQRLDQIYLKVKP